jgi:hypothetical protein
VNQPAFDLSRALSTTPSRRTSAVRIVCLILTSCVFAVDLQVELGISTYVLYVPVLVLAARVPGARFTVVLAFAATVLTVLAYFWSPAGGETWKVITSCALGIGAIWMTAGFLVQQKRITTDRDEAVARASAPTIPVTMSPTSA